MAAKAYSIIITGRVQGVGFRYHTQRTAQALGLKGWVRNRPDGAVEVWAEGEESALEGLLDWLRHGPPTARVSACQVCDAAPDGISDFVIRPTR